MSSLLLDILRNVERSQSVLIKDSVQVTPGRNLLRCFANRKNTRSHVLVNEVDPCVWHEGSGNINHLYDYYSDPLHWDDDGTHASQLSTASIITSVAERVKKVEPSSPSGHCVLIDSLSVLLRRHGLSAITELLDTLPGAQLPGGECITCLVAYLHGDLHNDNDIQCLEQMVSTVISLERSPVPGKQLCSITHQKRSGKILHKKEVFVITTDFTISSTEYIPSADHTQHMGDIVNPTIGLPFNLTLSDKEKKDRSQVRLPYKYTDTQKAETLEGRVFYEPDAVDDWDDSDPDDDLDI